MPAWRGGRRKLPFVRARWGPLARQKLAANLHVDEVVPGDDLSDELLRRLATAEEKVVPGYQRRRAVLPL